MNTSRLGGTPASHAIDAFAAVASAGRSNTLSALTAYPPESETAQSARVRIGEVVLLRSYGSPSQKYCLRIASPAQARGSLLLTDARPRAVEEGAGSLLVLLYLAQVKVRNQFQLFLADLLLGGVS
jgi:hypothetical protein